MILCPKNAYLFGENDLKHETLAAWCRRVYRPSSVHCLGCDLCKQFGVCADTEPKKSAGTAPKQGRLF